MDEILEQVKAICLTLPCGTCQINGSHATFRNPKKVFLYYLNNHHGDGIISICAKLAAGENKLLVQSDPRRFYLPAYIAHRGWVALRLDQGEIDWEEVVELIKESYRQSISKLSAVTEPYT